MAISPISFPTYQVNSAVDPSTWQSLGNLGNVYAKAQADKQKQSILSQLGPDAAANANLLVGSGQGDLAEMGLRLQGQLRGETRDDARNTVNDAYRDKQLAIQQAQEARAAEKDAQDTPQWRAKNLVNNQGDPTSPEGKAYIIGPGYKGPTPSEYEIKEIENNGVKTLVRVKKQGVEGVIPGTEPGPAANPFVAGGGKGMNHDQAQAATYTDRMADAHTTINQFEKINDGLGGAVAGSALEASKGIPGTAVPRNWVMSGDRQQFDQAKRNFVNAILRKESGAAISPSEFANAEQQYFPQPGDSQDVIALKQSNRLTAMRGMAREAGVAYHPPAHIIPPELRRPSAGQGEGADEALRLARNDIANRVPRDQVEARLKAQGIDPGLIDKSAKTVTKTGTVTDGPNKGKTVTLYSDGTKEYK